MTPLDASIEFQKGHLTRDQLHPDPIVQFQHWYTEAWEAGEPFANAMSLATVSNTGVPSVRTVLLKEVGVHGFVFFTNYQSRKGREIEHRPEVGLLFLWKGLERQVSVTGRAVKLSAADSSAYYATRPRNSQLGALVSPQSQVISSRAYLEERFAAADRACADKPIARPEHWGGYGVIPHTMEFWQGRPSRLHDRFLYTAQDDRSWTIDRLAP